METNCVSHIELLERSKISHDNAIIFRKIIEKEIVESPKGFWNHETKVQAIRYLILCELNWSKEQVYNNLSGRLIDSMGFRSIRKRNKISELVIEAFPEENYKLWNFKKVSDFIWDKDTISSAIIYLVEEDLNIPLITFSKMTIPEIQKNVLGKKLLKMVSKNKKKLVKLFLDAKIKERNKSIYDLLISDKVHDNYSLLLEADKILKRSVTIDTIQNYVLTHINTLSDEEQSIAYKLLAKQNLLPLFVNAQGILDFPNWTEKQYCKFNKISASQYSKSLELSTTFEYYINKRIEIERLVKNSDNPTQSGYRECTSNTNLSYNYTLKNGFI